MEKKKFNYNIGDTFYMLEDEPNFVLMKAGLQQPIYKCKVKCIGTTKEWRKAPYSFGNNYKCGYTNEEHMYRTLKEAKKEYWKRLDGKLTALTQEYNKQYGIILDDIKDAGYFIPELKRRYKINCKFMHINNKHGLTKENVQEAIDWFNEVISVKGGI